MFQNLGKVKKKKLEFILKGLVGCLKDASLKVALGTTNSASRP